jgi:hypothetical protein
MRQVIRVSVGQADAKAAGAGPASTGKGEPIFADVLVGEDGIARGIRIVHKD